jgi:hypothetical protein
VVHDLDQNDVGRLFAELNAAIAPAHPRASIVLIPKREIEAWLLYDANAIARAFRQNQHLPLPGNPETLPDPKKHLQTLVERRYSKNYLNTVHNELIAKHIAINALRRCASFRPHIAFAANVRQIFRSATRRH